MIIKVRERMRGNGGGWMKEDGIETGGRTWLGGEGTRAVQRRWGWGRVIE